MTALAWEGCLNVRDLGGLPTEDGRRTRAGRVVRSDNVRRLTDAGWRALADHGVTRIVDLRWPEELAEDQPRDVDIEVVHVSVLGDGYDEEYVAQLDEHLDSVDDMADHYAWSYVDFLERYRDRFGLALRAVADADGAVVVHCMGGKDRTGLVAALLLRLAGVPHEAVAADYALSGRNLEPRTVEWLAEAPDEATRARRARLGATPAEGMVRVLEEIESRYGEVAAYLRAAGLTEEQVARLQERLVAP
ncbi:MAG: tyrosine-protein phosphatase [Actinomycetota bacterium]|jgi:protein-tyrosine phosphatase|nr:tyrosine-protein phosphatase [Actinomycetota bacterium]